MKKVLFILFFTNFLWCENLDIEKDLKKIHSLCVIEDFPEAKTFAENAMRKYSENIFLQKAYAQTLALNFEDEKAVALFKKLFPSLNCEKQDKYLIEDISWSILTKGLFSDQYETKLAAIIGAYLTKDVRALFFLLKGMQDGNADVRALSINLASHFPDSPLKKEFKRLLHEEKLWYIRLEVIRAIGTLKLHEFYSDLEEVFLSSSSSMDEKGYALEALINMTDTISLEKLKNLFLSERAALRQFACSIALHLQISEAKDWIIHCMEDKSGFVREVALYAYSLYFHEMDTLSKQKEIFAKAISDFNPQVAIMALWGYCLIDPQLACKHLKYYLESSSETVRYYAAAAVSSCGSRATNLAYETLLSHKDLFVKLNVALGLIGQNAHCDKAYDVIYDFLKNEKRKINFKDYPFKELTVSHLSHIPDMSMYPETIDMETRLYLINILAQASDKRALELMKNYLQNPHWGIAAMACASLLQEGDVSAITYVEDLLQDKNPSLRIQAAIMLASLGKDSKVLPVLEKAYFEVDHEKKQMILEAMGEIATIKNLSFFVDVLEDPFYVRKILAASSLLRSLYH